MLFYADMQRYERIRGAPDFTTADGRAVFNRLVMNDVPDEAMEPLLERLKTTIAQVDTHGWRFVRAEVEFAENIGESAVVETTPEDVVAWVQRRNHRKLSKIVYDKKAPPTNIFTVELMMTGGGYLLTAAWFGKIEMEPDDLGVVLLMKKTRISRRHIYERCRHFWQNHAFVERAVRYSQHTLVKEQPAGWSDGPKIRKRSLRGDLL